MLGDATFRECVRNLVFDGELQDGVSLTHPTFGGGSDGLRRVRPKTGGLLK